MPLIATTASFAEDALNRLFEAGSDGLPWWKAPELANDLNDNAADEQAYDKLLEAHRRGACARALRAVELHLAGMSCSYRRVLADGRSVEEDYDPADVDVHALIEAAAAVADIPAEDLIEIVRKAAPAACGLIRHSILSYWAEDALHDFQRVPALIAEPIDDMLIAEPVTPNAPAPAIDDQSDDWKPKDLGDPSAWLNPPAKLFGTLRSIDFDPTIETRPPSWLVKGVAPRQGLGLLYGASGAGKTFLAIHAALSVAWGLPFFGKRTKRGGVLYVAAEGGSSVMPRIRAANAELSGVISAANLARPAGEPPLSRAPLRVVTEAPNLSRDGDSGPLLRTILQAQADFAAQGVPLAMVVIDTWHAAMGGGEENSAADVGAALAPIREAAEAGSFFALLIHHPGKDIERGARGSNALPAAVDASIELRVPGCDGANVPSGAMRQATVVKMRDGETGAAFAYRLPAVVIGEDEDGDPWTTCVVQPCEAPKADGALSRTARVLIECVGAAIEENGKEPASLNEVRLRFGATMPNAAADAKRQAWSRALKAARAAGRIATDDHDLSVWIPASPSP